MTRSHLAACAALCLTAGPAPAEDLRATIAAGHPPVFRWVRMVSEVFVPEVQARL